jgi:hypothetical protein
MALMGKIIPIVASIKTSCRKRKSFQHFNPGFMATIIFTPEQNQTLLDWTMEFESKELFETVVKVFKADEGLKQHVEKL